LRNAKGKLFVSVVALRPKVVFSGLHRPTEADFPGLHHKAHEEYFIANSVVTEVLCESRMETI
jgi:organic hydroperoxide reductase OsmC/OhrA